MNDRNKTTLTHEVTQATAVWLDNFGFKPVETEVSVERGWCADLAGVICPTQTELINLKLLRRPPSWNEMNSTKAGAKRRTWNDAQYVQWREDRDKLCRLMTCLVEVKTTRADFRGDRKWKAPIPTDLAYLAVPKGLIAPEEYPEGWGILEVNKHCIRRLRPPIPAQTTAEQQRDVVLEIATRRDHHTRYARWREINKERRVRDGEEITLRRVSEVTRMVLMITRGEHNSVAEVLDRHRIKGLPAYVIEQLQQLWPVNPATQQTN